MKNEMNATGRAVLAFGPFRLMLDERALLLRGKRVRLGSRAREILFMLVERAGETVRKNDLIARVWPGIAVEEGTLRVHISALRRVLADGAPGLTFIENVNGHGYRFIAPIERRSAVGSTLPETPLEARARFTRIIGRDSVIATVAQRLQQQRLLTLVGPGGVGKTTVAAAAVEKLSTFFADGVRFVDLSTASSPEYVAAETAFFAELREKHTLVVLDNSEHVISPVAAATETLLKSSPGVHVLATSREPLRVSGESVLRLAPLEMPRVSAPAAAAEALRFSAIQLFVELATASCHTFELNDANAATVVEICRRLDGLPLAIELAAARMDLLGLKALAAHLDDPLNLLTHGRRTATPRQQTLRANLEWSVNLLSKAEQTALRRLASLPGSFDLASARSALAGSDIGSADALEIVTGLCARSIVLADGGGDKVQFRLLETFRAFALEKAPSSNVIAFAGRRLAQ